MAYASYMPALPAIVTDRLDRFADLLAAAPANASTAHPVEGIAWSYVIRNAVGSVLAGVVEVTDFALQGVMPERQAVMPISARLYLDEVKRGKSIKRDVAAAREILAAFCATVIANPTKAGIDAAFAQLLLDTKGAR